MVHRRESGLGGDLLGPALHRAALDLGSMGLDPLREALARLDQANELIDVVTAAEAGLLDELKAKLDAQLRDRQEILP